LAAAHESGIGPSRHIAPPRNLGRYREYSGHQMVGRTNGLGRE
jgi:hypothetical protein